MINRLADKAGIGYIDINPFTRGTMTSASSSAPISPKPSGVPFLAIPRGKMEAGLAFAMTRCRFSLGSPCRRWCATPFPGLNNKWLVMIKATGASVDHRLLMTWCIAPISLCATRQPFTFYATIAALYLAVTTVSIIGLGWLERRFSLGVQKGRFLMIDWPLILESLPAYWRGLQISLLLMLISVSASFLLSVPRRSPAFP